VQSADVVLVVGARQSSNSVRLCEVARASGVPAYLADCAASLQRVWFSAAETIGLTAGASVPEVLVTQVLARLRDWWPDLQITSIGEPETVQFRLPRSLERDAVDTQAAAGGA